ncbi:MAG TPA: glutamate racemase [Longimicrobium sp.]|nr:glutamate racemase [Longimicrobium sp.]
MSDAPVGVFDSGVGGLSVAREIRRRLPAERILYFADTAFCPYGGRPLDEIRERSIEVVGELVRRGAKLVVVACNTASGAALEALRDVFPIPIVGLEPAVKPATERSRNRRVGVLATEATLRTERFHRLVRTYGVEADVLPKACPELVDLVEAGETEGKDVEQYLAQTLAPLIHAGVDTVVLGCTHYPFLRGAIGRVMGPEVEILDSGEAVARQVERVLRDSGSQRADGDGDIVLLTTGEPSSVGEIARRLWGAPLPVQSVGQLRSEGAVPSGERTR